MPNRNSTTSEPSRSTATATTRAIANNERSPSTTDRPIAFISCAIWRPWLAIQVMWMPSMNTATSRIAALNSSWPTPEKAVDSAPANAATRAAPPIPAAMPAAIQRPRPSTPSVAASTIPMMRPASSTSRNTMISVASMAYSFTVTVPVASSGG